MKEVEVNFYYLSALAFAEQTGLGYQTVLDLCKKGDLKAIELGGGRFQVKVYKHEAVSKEDYNRLLKENIELKARLENISKLVG